MDSKESVADKPHAVCVPAPAQGHIKAMLKLAKLLHHEGFHITFVNTESNHKHFLKSLGPNSLDGLLDFQFESIPDGIPAFLNLDECQVLLLVCEAIMKDKMLDPFREFLSQLDGQDSAGPPVTCVVYDGLMPFANTAAEELGVLDCLTQSSTLLLLYGI